MKYVVISDSHGRVGTLEKILFNEQFDAVIFLGDGASDIKEVMNYFPGKGLVQVVGNCDFVSGIPAERTVLTDGCNVLLCHGHLFNVKGGTDRLIYKAQEQHATAVLYGHTHIPELSHVDGMLVLNPGSAGFGDTYATLTLENGKASAELKSAVDYK